MVMRTRWQTFRVTAVSRSADRDRDGLDEVADVILDFVECIVDANTFNALAYDDEAVLELVSAAVASGELVLWSQPNSGRRGAGRQT